MEKAINHITWGQEITGEWYIINYIIVLNKFNSANPSVEFDNVKYVQKLTVDNRYDDLLNKAQ